MNTALIGALALAAVACGGTPSQGTSTTSPAASPAVSGDHQHAAGPAGHAENHGEHGKMAPSITKFHDTLAPRWHAERGPKRMADTCAAVAELQHDAAAIVAAPAPAGANPASWSAGGKQLADSVGALEVTCKANDAAAFEPAFERVHTSFHHVMEAGGAHH